MVSRSVCLVLALLLFAVALAACQPPTALPPEPAASPTEPAAATPEPAATAPEQEAVSEPETAPVLIVSDRPFTLAELQALDQVTTDDGSEAWACWRSWRLREWIQRWSYWRPAMATPPMFL